MSKSTILDYIKDFVGSISWKLFLWSNGITAEQYFKAIYQQELNYKKDKEYIKKVNENDKEVSSE